MIKTVKLYYQNEMGEHLSVKLVDVEHFEIDENSTMTVKVFGFGEPIKKYKKVSDIFMTNDF